MMDSEFAADGPITPENWAQPVAKREPQRQPEGDFYKWTLTPGRPLELYRRPLTCFGRTWTLDTWSRKLHTTPRNLHGALIQGLRAGKKISDVLSVDLNADMPLNLGSERRKKTSSAQSVHQTPEAYTELLRRRLTSIEKRTSMTRPNSPTLDGGSRETQPIRIEQSGENLCAANH